VGVGVELRWVAVSVGKGVRQRALRQSRSLGEHLADRFAVKVTEFPCGQCFFEV
jgi:hypothetical protein